MDLGAGEELFMNMIFRQGQRMTHHICLSAKVFLKTADVKKALGHREFFVEHQIYRKEMRAVIKM
jgi:hypothetical protein